MMTQRRTLLAAAGGLLAAGPALAQQADPRMGLRAMGDASAPVTVLEFFSLTCSHCGAFHRDTWPRVRAELVQTGRVRMVWRDFPLDQVALRAHAVARAFPEDRYEAFLTALFTTQDRWAYARGADHKAEIGKIAAMAGMAPAAFEAAWADDDLARAIILEAQAGGREFNVQATPTFVFGRRVVSGNIGFDRFAREAATP
ncbi:thioredoxin domain-containing protein [Roseomonas alkaliterrae]|nr:thioredoxin domain-containing protein [Neoroseomonas alkaliterrae]